MTFPKRVGEFSVNTFRLRSNTKAAENGEHECMVAIQLKNDNLDTTDFVFHGKDAHGHIKAIFSEMSKDDLKRLLCALVDEYHRPY